MNNIDIDQLIALSGEHFYRYIDENYGKLVVKILRYYDIDSYSLLKKINLQQLIEPFEKPDNDNCTDELINLKKETCTVLNESISLKLGTKEKLKFLLNSAHDILKEKQSRIRLERKNNRISQNRSSTSSTDDNGTMNEQAAQYKKSINESIRMLLVKINGNIHGGAFTNVSVASLEINLQCTSSSQIPACSIRCIGGSFIKLYFKQRSFQLSNLFKHFIGVISTRTLSSDSESEEINQSQQMNQLQQSSHTQSAINQTTRKIRHNNSNAPVREHSTTRKASTPEGSAAKLV